MLVFSSRFARNHGSCLLAYRVYPQLLTQTMETEPVFVSVGVPRQPGTVPPVSHGFFTPGLVAPGFPTRGYHWKIRQKVPHPPPNPGATGQGLNQGDQKVEVQGENQAVTWENESFQDPQVEQTWIWEAQQTQEEQGNAWEDQSSGNQGVQASQQEQSEDGHDDIHQNQLTWETQSQTWNQDVVHRNENQNHVGSEGIA